MVAHEVIITDVTCYGDLYCVAGWDTGLERMIRPEPPTANAIAEVSRFWGGLHAGPNRSLAVGNIVRFQASPPLPAFPFPHATEDRLVSAPIAIEVVGNLTAAVIAERVEDGVSASIEAAFGGELIRGHSGKCFVPAGTQVCSLDAIEIEPHQISFYEDNPKPGKRRLRAVIEHGGLNYDLSVPADAARTQFLAQGIASLDATAAASDRIHVRLGLCRPFAAMPDTCYAQVNGLYFLA